MRIIKKGATSQSLELMIYDSTSGLPLTGLAYNTATLTADYALVGGSRTTITLATLAAANSAYSSGGFKEIDAANMPGLYRFDPPNAALTGADSVAIILKGGGNMSQVSEQIQLIGVDLQDTVRAGMTSLPNAAAEAAGGLFTRGTGAGQINQPANGRIVTVADITAIWAYVVEGTHTAVEYMRLMASSLFAILAGGGTTTVTVRDVDNTKTRITATVDSNGNRSAVTIDGT